MRGKLNLASVSASGEWGTTMGSHQSKGKIEKGLGGRQCSWSFSFKTELTCFCSVSHCFEAVLRPPYPALLSSSSSNLQDWRMVWWQLMIYYLDSDWLICIQFAFVFNFLFQVSFTRLNALWFISPLPSVFSTDAEFHFLCSGFSTAFLYYFLSPSASFWWFCIYAFSLYSCIIHPNQCAMCNLLL